MLTINKPDEDMNDIEVDRMIKIVVQDFVGEIIGEHSKKDIDEARVQEPQSSSSAGSSGMIVTLVVAEENEDAPPVDEGQDVPVNPSYSSESQARNGKVFVPYPYCLCDGLSFCSAFPLNRLIFAPFPSTSISITLVFPPELQLAYCCLLRQEIVFFNPLAPIVEDSVMSSSWILLLPDSWFSASSIRKSFSIRFPTISVDTYEILYNPRSPAHSVVGKHKCTDTAKKPQEAPGADPADPFQRDPTSVTKGFAACYK
ncbi:hypothetical protein Tco_0456207 [Tanacetum coccineum]